jgi:hypothetical protein
VYKLAYTFHAAVPTVDFFEQAVVIRSARVGTKVGSWYSRKSIEVCSDEKEPGL